MTAHDKARITAYKTADIYKAIIRELRKMEKANRMYATCGTGTVTHNQILQQYDKLANALTTAKKQLDDKYQQGYPGCSIKD